MPGKSGVYVRRDGAATIGPMGSKAEKMPRLALIVSRYNGAVTADLRAGAERVYAARGGKRSGLDIFEAPGAFELSVLSSEAALTGRYAGVLALGCVIKGDTRHDEYINHALAQGLTQAAVRTGVPIAFGVVTTENAKQAKDRAGGSAGNKGEEAMMALLDVVAELKAVRKGKPRGAGGGIEREVKDKTKGREKPQF